MRLTIATDLPPTTNNAYRDFIVEGRVRRALTGDGKAFKAATGLRANAAASKAGWRYEQGQRLGLHLALVFPNNARADISNRIKLVEDAVAEALGFDDRVVDLLVVERCANGEPQCVVTLEVLR